MSARTIENCTVIKKCIKEGIGEPKQYYYLNRCEGYAPFEKCKKCKFYIPYSSDETSNEVKK